MYRLLLAEMNVRHDHDDIHHQHSYDCRNRDASTTFAAAAAEAVLVDRARHSSEDENRHSEHRRRPPIPNGRETRKQVPIIRTPHDQQKDLHSSPSSPTCPHISSPEPPSPIEVNRPIAIAKGPAATMRRINMQRAGTQEDIPHDEGYAYDEAYAEMQRLTPSQREIVKRTFPAMEADAVRNALQVLLLLFSEHPRYKNIWPQFRAIPDSALMSAVELRRHASVYMTGLRSIIDAMDDEISLADQLKRIARAHIKWNIHKVHVMNMLLPVLDVLANTLNQKPLQTDIAEAWTTLYDVIANLIDIFREVERRASLKGRGSVSSSN